MKEIIGLSLGVWGRAAVGEYGRRSSFDRGTFLTATRRGDLVIDVC